MFLTRSYSMTIGIVVDSYKHVIDLFDIYHKKLGHGTL
jgi:hypothetical protein